MTDNDRLVLLAVFHNPNEAEIARGLLESHGVMCFLHNDNLMKTVSYLQVSAGGVRLMVLLSDFDAAREVLGDVEGDFDISDKPFLSRSRWGFVRFLFGLLFGIAAPFKSHKQREDDLFK